MDSPARVAPGLAELHGFSGTSTDMADGWHGTRGELAAAVLVSTRYEGAVGVYSKCAGGLVPDHIKMMEGFLCNDLCHRLSPPCCE